MRPAFAGRLQRLPPAVVFDLPVLLILMICWATVAVALAHLITGLALIAMIMVHLASRRRRVGRLFRSSHAPVTARKVVLRIGYLLFLVVATAMAVSGLLRWAGVPPLYVQHAASSYALLTLVAVHLVMVRRPLRARLMRKKNPNRTNGSDS